MSGYSINRIPLAYRTFADSTVLAPAWTSGDMDIFIPSGSIGRYDGVGSIKCQIEDVPSNVYVRYDAGVAGIVSSMTKADDIGDFIEAFVWIKSEFPVTVNSRINLVHPSTSSSIYNGVVSTRVDSPDWTLVRCGAIEVPNTSYVYSINLDLQFSNFNSTLAASKFMYISFPVMYSQSEFLGNPALMDIFLRLPETIQNGSLNENLPSLAFTRFIELACASRGYIFDAISNITTQDISEGYDDSDPETKSILVNPDVVIRRFAFWLAQFVGTRLINPQVSATPWGNMPSTWQGIDMIDLVNSASDAVDWQDLQDYLPEIFGLDEYYRWQISTAYHGYAAGTIGALEGAVKRVLTGTKYVNLIFSGFTCTYQTKKSETPGSQLIALGQPVPEIVDIIEATRPAGVVINHVLVA